MKINETVYGWEFINMTKVEVNVIKKLIEAGIFGSMYHNIDFENYMPSLYKVKFKRSK